MRENFEGGDQKCRININFCTCVKIRWRKTIKIVDTLGGNVHLGVKNLKKVAAFKKIQCTPPPPGPASKNVSAITTSFAAIKSFYNEWFFRRSTDQWVSFYHLRDNQHDLRSSRRDFRDTQGDFRANLHKFCGN